MLAAPPVPRPAPPHRLRSHRLIWPFITAACLLFAVAVLAGCSGQDADDDASLDQDTSAPSTPDQADLSGADADSASDSESIEDAGSDMTPEVAVDPVRWEPCDEPFQCATVTVPLDHQEPSGETIDLGVIRVEASGDPLGSVFINLGGPGGSTVSAIRNGFRLDDETMERYHLVGFDPRGIGLSSPLTCDVDLTDAPRPDLSPDTDEERAALDATAQDLANACGDSDGDLLPHLGTESVVADLELLRRAVGDEDLHYLGLSYGTVLGLRYAEQHPNRVGRMVLDGVVDPSFSLPDLLAQQALEFERAFVTLDAGCGQALTCPEDGVLAAYDRIAASLEQSGPQGGVGGPELEVATLVAMYSERFWPRYGEALVAADNGDFSGIERLHDLYVGGTSFAAYAAVSCIDSRTPNGSGQWDAFAADLAARAPRFGAALANELRACAYWPAAPTSTPKPVVANTKNPILILSTTGDAPTPLANAMTVSETLVSAGLVITEDEGHTAFGKNFCVERIVTDYFATGTVQDEPHRC